MKKISLALAVGLLLSACGGGDSSPTPTTKPSTPTASKPTNSSTNQPSQPAQPPKTNNTNKKDVNQVLRDLNNNRSGSTTTNQTRGTGTTTNTGTTTTTTPTSTGTSQNGQAHIIHDISRIQSNMVAQPTSNEKMLIDAIIAETNAYRKSKGLSPLRPDDSLIAYAEIRAEEYANRDKSRNPHSRANGSSSLDAAYFDLGDKGGTSAENLAELKGYTHQSVQQQAKAIVNVWINSPSHRANLEKRNVTRIGIGVNHNGSEGYYAQIFAGGTMSSNSYLGNQALSSDQVRAGLNKVVSIDGNKQLKISGGTSNREYYGSSYRVNLANNREIIIKNESAWKSQTIGVVEEKDKPIAYLNIGQSHKPGEINSVSGTYKGALLGDINGGDRLRADVTAVINGKNMTLQTANTHSIDPEVVTNLNANKEMIDTARKELKELDFSDNLTWNANSGQFESASNPNLNHARFYGNSAQEIGGQFSRSVNQNYGKDRYDHNLEYKGTYRGAYGATKQ